MAKSKSDESIGYAQALEELESILAELEEDDVDVDKLATQVQRASQLIECVESESAMQNSKSKKLSKVLPRSNSA